MRGSDAVKGSYREVLEKLVEIFMDDLDEPQRRERALALPPCAWRLRDAQMRRRSGVAHRRLDGAHLKASAQDAAERTIAKTSAALP
jgi:hypothetical protein